MRLGGLRNAGVTIVQQSQEEAENQPIGRVQHHQDKRIIMQNESLDSLDILAGSAEQSLQQKVPQRHPSVAGFLYCTFFDDEKLWTAEYDGPNDCEIQIQGNVSDGGLLWGNGPNKEYSVKCTVVRGNPNALKAGSEIIIDGLTRHSDGNSMGRCVFTKQRSAGRDGYKGLATWRLTSCNGDTPNPMTRPKKRRFSADYKKMTDNDWGDMDMWLAFRCITPVFNDVNVDLRVQLFSSFTTTDYINKTQLITLTRSLCEFAGPASFTQSILDSWGELYPNPLVGRRPKFLSRVHFSHWIIMLQKILNFKLGLIIIKSGFLSRQDISCARQANFGQMGYYILDQAAAAM